MLPFWLTQMSRYFETVHINIKVHLCGMIATSLWRATLHGLTPLLQVEGQRSVCAVTGQSARWTLSISHHMSFIDDRYIKAVEEGMACSDSRPAANQARIR